MSGTDTTPERLSLVDALGQMQRIHEADPSRPMRLVIRKSNPGALAGHQTTDVQAIYAGFDHEAGRLVLQPVRPLTELTAEQVEAIYKSVRMGSSWHAYEREKGLRARITDLEGEVARLRAAAGTP
jgi:hypothetical protein